MATWKVARRTKTCALSGKPIPPASPVVTALYGADEETSEDKVKGTGFSRKDFLEEGADPAALEAALDGAYCTWRAKSPADDGPKTPRLDLAMAGDLLERLLVEADPARAAVTWSLSLLLVRKRRLTLVGEKDGVLTFRRPKDEGTFQVATVVVTEAEEEALTQELGRLFEA
jgi:hypothetical protein